MVGISNIKINSSMIEDFDSPVSEMNNRNTYLRVNDNGKIDYIHIDDVIEEIEKNGGVSGDGKKRLDVWDKDITYERDDTVIYANSIWQCIVTSSKHDIFDFDDWKLIAGYSKKSYFYYSGENEINQLTLDEEVANKESFSVNLNNLVLQSNNYNLETDQKTITFLEPIPTDTNVEVIVYGNMIIPTDVSNIVVKNFTATENQTEFDLGEKILKKELITVNIENSVIMNSEWDLSEDKTKLILKNPVSENTRVQITWFNDIDLQIGATFTPHVSKIFTDTILSWTNDGGLDNPPTVHIKDGATFTPQTSKTGTNTTISWTNNAELDNPDDVIISDGATFTPQTSKTGLETTISWTNNDGLENPDDVVIKDGATFTPQIETTPHEVNISWTNDGGLSNPEPISIYTNYAQRIVDSFTATEGQTEFVASHEIYDKSVLSVNVGNTELTYAAYTLGTDKKTVTLVNGLSEGTLVNLKYFYNLNIGVGGGDSNLPPISAETAGLVLGNNGTDLEWVKGASTGEGTVKDDIGNVILTTKTVLSDGENWCDGSTHTKAEFPEYYKKLVDGDLASVDFTVFDSTPACGVSGLDTTTETFKFPKIEDVYIKIGANYNEPYGAESLPNITGITYIRGISESSSDTSYDAFVANSNISDRDSGAFKISNPNIPWKNNTRKHPELQSVSKDINKSNVQSIEIDASRSSSTYQNDAKVNPDHITLRAYVISKPTMVSDISVKGLEIGDIGFSAFGIDETKNLRRYLNGQVISQSQFESFTTKIKAAIQLYSTLATTETNWQAEVTNSKLGQCGKFVIDDTAGTIRLPKVVNINGLTDLSLMGGIKAESLPNIEGTFGAIAGWTPTGAFEGGETIVSNTGTSGSAITRIKTTLDASRSSSTYQNNAPVQQEAVQYPYFIQVATGSEDEVNITNEIQLNNPFSLFDVKFESKQTPLTNGSWLVGSNVWHSGTVYVTAYQALVVELNEEIAKGTTVTLPNGTRYTKRGLMVAPKEAYSEGELEDYFFVDIATQTFKLPKKSRINNTFTRYINTGVGEGYEIYSDGWCRQWGVTYGGFSSDLYFVSLPKKYKDTDYLIYGNKPVLNNSEDIFTLGSPVNFSVVTDIAASVASRQKDGFYIKAEWYNKTWITEGYLEADDPDMPEPYFYVGETIQDANVINAAGVLTRVANCIDRTVASDRETVVGWGIPDYSARVSLTAQQLLDGYTAPVDGVVTITAQAANGSYFLVDGVGVGFVSGQISQSYAPVEKGSVVSISASLDVLRNIFFYPLKGVN